MCVSPSLLLLLFLSAFPQAPVAAAARKVAHSILSRRRVSFQMKACALAAVVSLLLLQEKASCFPAAFLVGPEEYKVLTRELWAEELRKNFGAELSTSIGSQTFDQFVSRKPTSEYINSTWVKTFIRLLEEQRPELEEECLNHFSNTEIFEIMKRFLVRKGMTIEEIRKVFRTLWFTSTYKGEERPKSTGFKHVFQGENQARSVQGFHNWIRFYLEATLGNIQHIQVLHIDTLSTTTNKYFVKMKFLWKSMEKTMSSMFFGTTPEYELAIYTLCAYIYPGPTCKVSCGPYDVTINSITAIRDGFDLLTTSYPTEARLTRS